jgi:hypothetical protein
MSNVKKGQNNPNYGKKSWRIRKAFSKGRNVW